MCKYCEKMTKNVVDVDEYNVWTRYQSVLYPEPYDFFLIKDGGGWYIALGDEEDNIFIDRIAHCPWCGRKLESPNKARMVNKGGN